MAAPFLPLSRRANLVKQASKPRHPNDAEARRVAAVAGWRRAAPDGPRCVSEPAKALLRARIRGSAAPIKADSPTDPSEDFSHLQFSLRHAQYPRGLHAACAAAGAEVLDGTFFGAVAFSWKSPAQGAVTDAVSPQCRERGTNSPSCQRRFVDGRFHCLRRWRTARAELGTTIRMASDNQQSVSVTWLVLDRPAPRPAGAGLLELNRCRSAPSWRA